MRFKDFFENDWQHFTRRFYRMEAIQYILLLLVLALLGVAIKNGL